MQCFTSWLLLLDVLGFYLIPLMFIASPSVLELIGDYLFCFLAFYGLCLAYVYITEHTTYMDTMKPFHFFFLFTLPTFGLGFPIFRLVAYSKQDNSLMVTLIASIMGASALLAPLMILAFILIVVNFPKLTRAN